MVRTAAVIGVTLTLVSGVSACGGQEQACGPITREALDPDYLVHVLEDGPGLEYRSEPPTSGPHQPSPPVQGAIDRELSRPVQVGILEGGSVLIQFRPDDLDADAEAALAALAGDQVVVAPAPDLPSPIVATAWVFKRACDEPDVELLQDFIDERVGHGPDDPGGE